MDLPKDSHFSIIVQHSVYLYICRTTRKNCALMKVCTNLICLIQNSDSNSPLQLPLPYEFDPLYALLLITHMYKYISNNITSRAMSNLFDKRALSIGQEIWELSVNVSCRKS